MSDALPLPPRPNLEQYKKLAKDFQHACKSKEPGAFRSWTKRWAEQLARLQGGENTPDLNLQIEYEVERIEHGWQHLCKKNPRLARCALADAQYFIARAHGFLSWLKFVKHLEGVLRATSPISQFEKAADAIISGDVVALAKLLRKNPELIRARSTRDHRSTLLHYVSANGIEDFRQKTPKNIVEITKLLLDSGADVNAESDAYGGRSITLGLAATSCHPEDAGVQIPLLEFLIARGSLLDGPDGSSVVNACLHNGRGEAAEFCAARGAKLDLEGAAGVGRLDVVKSCFDQDRTLKPPATQNQMLDGFAWACEYGRTSVVEFLLERGVELDAKLRHDRQTGLHWAAYGGHADTVKLLLARGAPVDARDASYDGTPLGWALYAWGNMSERLVQRGRYYEVVALLARAGSKLDPGWYEDDPERKRAAKKLASDPRMQAALRGEFT